MAGFFQRLFKIGQSEAHAVLDNMEDPIRMTEQGIRDLKNDLQASMTSLAEVKSVAIRLRKDADSSKSLAPNMNARPCCCCKRCRVARWIRPKPSVWRPRP